MLTDLEYELWHLRTLAAARFTGDDEDAVTTECVQDVVAVLIDR